LILFSTLLLLYGINLISYLSTLLLLYGINLISYHLIFHCYYIGFGYKKVLDYSDLDICIHWLDSIIVFVFILFISIL